MPSHQYINLSIYQKLIYRDQPIKNWFKPVFSSARWTRPSLLCGWGRRRGGGRAAGGSSTAAAPSRTRCPPAAQTLHLNIYTLYRDFLMYWTPSFISAVQYGNSVMVSKVVFFHLYPRLFIKQINWIEALNFCSGNSSPLIGRYLTGRRDVKWFPVTHIIVVTLFPEVNV